MTWLFTAGTATVTLTSTLEGRQAACPGEVVTYTCTVPRTTVVSWIALPDIDGVDYFPRSPLGQQTIRDFQLALTNKVPDPNNPALADLTTTLTVTATLARNGTVVQCCGDEPSERMSLVLNIASEYALLNLDCCFTIDMSCMCTYIMLVVSPMNNISQYSFFIALSI